MKKFLFSFIVLFCGVMGLSAQTTVKFTDLTASPVDGGVTFVAEPFTFVALKGNGEAQPAQDKTAKDLRAYANNTFQVTTTGDGIAKMVFTVSEQGKKKLASITPSVGTVTVDEQNWTVTWTGRSKDVTFTVGEKNVYGTESPRTTGHFCIDAVEITNLPHSDFTGEVIVTPADGSKFVKYEEATTLTFTFVGAKKVNVLNAMANLYGDVELHAMYSSNPAISEAGSMTVEGNVVTIELGEDENYTMPYDGSQNMYVQAIMQADVDDAIDFDNTEACWEMTYGYRNPMPGAYLIQNLRTGKYAFWRGDNVQIGQTEDKTLAAIWNVTVDGDYYRLGNHETENLYKGHSEFTAEGAPTYILESQYNEGYFVISLTPDASANCWDDQGNKTTVGYWQPSAGDNQGTSWKLIPVDEQYILDATLASLRNDAAALYASNDGPVKGEKLITSVYQLSSPYTEPTEGSLAALIDGNTGTFWHSQWSGDQQPENGVHYLEIALPEGTSGMIEMHYTRRPTGNDHLTKAEIIGVNGGETTTIATLDLPYGSNTETMVVTFTLDKAYEAIRILEIETTNNRGFWHASEMQLYPILDPVSMNSHVEDAAAALSAAIETAAAVEAASQSDIDALQTAIDEYTGAIQDYKDAVRDAELEKVLPTGADIALANVATGTFLGGANSWGTQASVVEVAQYFATERLKDGKYTLDSHTYNNATDHFLGSNLYVDAGPKSNGNPTWDWTIVPQKDGSFAIQNPADGKYVAAPAEGNVLVWADELSAAALWTAVTAEELTQRVVEAGKGDMTHLVKAAGFSRNLYNRDFTQNPWITETTNSNLNGGNNTNNIGESWHATFDIYQEVTVPNGIYTLTAQAVLRDDAGQNQYDGHEYPVVYANNATSVFNGLEEGDRATNSMAQVSELFTAGKYAVEPITIKVRDGKIRLGVRGTRVDTWATFDNFRLTYEGPVTGPESGTYMIQNKRTGKYAYWTGDDTQIGQTTEKTVATLWTVTENGLSYKLGNHETENLYKSTTEFTAEGAPTYILESQYNEGYFVISLTPDASASCWDDQGNTTTVGYWQPSASDNQGTSWKLIPMTEEQLMLTIDMEKLLAEATETYESNTIYNNGEKLITSVDQLSSPYTEPSEGSLAGLIDGNADTFWHSQWSGGSKRGHGVDYLEINLPEGTQGEIELSYTRRNTSGNQLTEAEILGVNGTEVTSITVIDLPLGSTTETLTATFTLEESYEAIRILEKMTTGNDGFWHAAEIQLYPTQLDPECLNAQHPDAAAEMKAALAVAKEVVANPTQADYDTLKAALETYINSLKATGIQGVATTGANAAIFNVAGQRVSKAGKGIYIINGKKMMVK